MRLATMFLVVVVCAGCSGGDGAPVEEAHTAQPDCAGLITQYRATLAAASGCESDTDCGTFGSLDPETRCGGATNIETARALAAIDAEADGACPRPAYSCIPHEGVRCADGACELMPAR